MHGNSILYFHNRNEIQFQRLKRISFFFVFFFLWKGLTIIPRALHVSITSLYAFALKYRQIIAYTKQRPNVSRTPTDHFEYILLLRTRCYTSRVEEGMKYLGIFFYYFLFFIF